LKFEYIKKAGKKQSFVWLLSLLLLMVKLEAMKCFSFLLALVVLMGPKDSFARKQKYWTAESAKLYITTMKYFDSYDQGWFGAPKPGQKSHADLNLIYATSYADDGIHCLVAGYAGTIDSNGKCKTTSPVFAADLVTCKSKGFDFPCSRDVFSSGPNDLTCGKVTYGSRWTASCVDNFFDKVGLKGKTLDSGFTSPELTVFAGALNASGVNMNSVLDKVKNLCSTVGESKRQLDIQDCQKLQTSLSAAQKTAPTTAPTKSDAAGSMQVAVTKTQADSTSTATSAEDALKKIVSTGVLKKGGPSTDPACDLSKPDTCTVASLTQNCSVFWQPNDHVFPDGSMIPSLKKIQDADNARYSDPKNLATIASNQLKINDDYSDAQKILADKLKEMPTLAARLAPSGTSTNQLLWDLLNNNSSTSTNLIGTLTWNKKGTLMQDYDPQYTKIKEYFDGQVSERQRQRLKEKLTEAKNLGDANGVLRTGYDPVQDGKSVTADQDQRVSKLVETVRASLIKTVMNGKSDADLTQSERDAIERIRTIQVNLPNDSKVYGNQTCNTKAGNAFYQPADHTINICASVLKNPDEALVSILAHEMGHSIDPCNIQWDMPIYKIDVSRVQNFAADQSPTMVKIRVAADQCKAAGLTTCSVFLKDRAEANQYATAAALLKREGQGQDLADYPFEGVKSCLQSPAGGGFHSNESAIHDLQLEAQDAVNQLNEGANLSPADRFAQQEKMKKLFSKTDCSSNFIKQPSQMQEVMADWFGNEVLNDYLRDHPRVGDAPEDKLRPIAFLAKNYCGDVASAQSARGLANITSRIASDSHPLNAERIDQIALREPEIRKYLGCTALSPQAKCSR